MSASGASSITPPGSPGGTARFIAFRLRPGDDLRSVIETRFAAEPEEAGFVAAAVGSLTWTHLRLADQDHATRFMGPMEILALSGTLSLDGPHLHASVAAADGHAIGGHLLTDSPVYTTAEIVLGLLDGVRFERPVDPETGSRELAIQPLALQDPADR